MLKLVEALGGKLAREVIDFLVADIRVITKLSGELWSVLI